MRKILLEKCKSKKSVNNSNVIPIELNRDVSLLHDEFLKETFDTMKLYNDERDNSTKHRFIFTLYPLCSNVLFNNITEIIYKECSTDTEILDDTTDKHNQLLDTKNVVHISNNKFIRKNAIRNTEYTNKEFNLTYHCGSDIFNNHLLRMKNDISVQKRNTGENIYKCRVYDTNYNYRDADDIDSFNTIGDYSRNFSGVTINIEMPSSSDYYVYKKNHKNNKKNQPLYTYDDVKSFFEAYSDGIKRKDGWIGFYNKTTMAFPMKNDDNGNPIYYVNKCFNNKSSCEFIDMCPERDLFYFTPKKNLNRNRLEYNWDMFLTYPYESVYEDTDVDDEYKIVNKRGLPLLFNEETLDYEEYEKNGINLVMFKSPVKHNLKVNDNIKFISENSGDTLVCKIIRIGDNNGKNKDRYFFVRKDDISILDLTDLRRFIKIVGGFECEYYYRKFKKIKINDKLPKNTLNKLAFSKTIYGDDVSQIVFTDDINIETLRDNRDRPLTEIYLTIIKTNRGHEEWYEKGKYKSDKVEYSHVFGKVTSGLDLPSYVKDKRYPTLRYQHNINDGKYCDLYESVEVKICNDSSKKIENDIINDENYDDFYGDLVEFNPLTLEEIVLEQVFHRFNTAQREFSGSTYGTIYYDEIYSDIYDAEHGELNSIIEHQYNSGYANIAPEGYIYKPHHKIKISEYDTLINTNVDFIMNVCDYIFDNETLTFETNINYSLSCGDIISCFDLNTKKTNKYKISNYTKPDNNNNFVGNATIINNNINDLVNSELKWFIHNASIPDYAYMFPDGSGRHSWRDIKKPSEMTFIDELNDVPYSNGSFYHYKNIIFPVRRQDPFYEYGMFITKDDKQIENNFEVPSVEFDSSEYEFFDINTEYTSCF